MATRTAGRGSPATTSPPGYPDAHPSGTPYDHYNPTSSRLAFGYADAVLDAVDAAWRQLREADGDAG